MLVSFGQFKAEAGVCLVLTSIFRPHFLMPPFCCFVGFLVFRIYAASSCFSFSFREFVVSCSYSTRIIFAV